MLIDYCVGEYIFWLRIIDEYLDIIYLSYETNVQICGISFCVLQTKEFNGAELMDFYKVAPVYTRI